MTALPEPVRARVVALASDVLGTLPGEEVPGALRAVARFAAAKRARLGGSTIAAGLESGPAFRARVLDAARRAYPGLVEAIDEGTPPAAAEPVEVAVVAFLLRPQGWESLVAAAGDSTRQAERAAHASRDAAAVERLREQLATARASARESRDRYKAEIDRIKAENAALRRRLNETRERVASAREAEQAAESALSQAVERADAGRVAAEAEARRLRARLAESGEALEAARRMGREGRNLDAIRLGLLIDTLAEAAAGLRRELALPATAQRPADTVPAAVARVPGVAEHHRARAPDDPAHLRELLALPKAHLVVDGYNVTKTAWADMPLDGQRTRLVQALGALAARTGAEVTCVFDGADVAVPPPVAASGVRVRFSPQGVTADELIRRLVRAEPDGRTVVVVSSDREVAAGVRRPAVHPVEAVALVRLLAR